MRVRFVIAVVAFLLLAGLAAQAIAEDGRLLDVTRLSHRERDLDVLRFGSCQNVRSIKLKARRGTAEIESLMADYGNGARDRLPVRQRIAEGSETAWSDLRGGVRCFGRSRWSAIRRCPSIRRASNSGVVEGFPPAPPNLLRSPPRQRKSHPRAAAGGNLTMLSAERTASLIERYAHGPRSLEAAIAGIPPDEMRWRPGPTDWSIHENVFHLADTDLVTSVRVRFILVEPGAPMPWFNQGAWAAVMRYADRSLADALAMFRATRAATVPLLRDAPTAAWSQSDVHPIHGSRTLEQVIEHYGNHVHYHLKTIAKRRQQFRDRREAPPA